MTDAELNAHSSEVFETSKPQLYKLSKGTKPLKPKVESETPTETPMETGTCT